MGMKLNDGWLKQWGMRKEEQTLEVDQMDRERGTLDCLKMENSLFTQLGCGLPRQNILFLLSSRLFLLQFPTSAVSCVSDNVPHFNHIRMSIEVLTFLCLNSSSILG